MLRLFQVLTGLLAGLALVALWLMRNPEPTPSALPPAMEASILEGRGGDWVGTAYPDPMEVPDFRLVDQEENPVGRAALRGQFRVMFFGYTHCPDVCPATLLHLTRARSILSAEDLAFGTVMVSVDPERDTPARLKAYLNAFDPTILGITGPPAEVEAFAEAMGIGYFTVPTDDPEGPFGAYTMDHTARTFVIDPEGLIVHSFPPFLSGDDMARDLRRILSRESDR